MVTFNRNHRALLKKHTRAIVHMRTQYLERKRLGLVFGAGLSKKFDLPSWDELVENIANDEDINASHLLGDENSKRSLSYKTEMIYQHFKKLKLGADNLQGGAENYRAKEYEIAGIWLETIRKHLYKEPEKKFSKQLKKHPYFEKLIPIIRNSHMTITYNFDDYIERALSEWRDGEEKNDSKGYEIITTPWSQFRRDTAVIYHPNGFAPQKTNMEAASDKVIFSESTFAEQILGHSAGDDSGLLSHLSKNTCLFIGLSLQDETVRAVLSKSAKRNPGSYHYYIDYKKRGDSNKNHEAITHTNFQVYNLITLFLDDSGISTLLDLINCGKEEFCALADECGVKLNYRFYLTGPLGVGKSTTISCVRNLNTYDEWLEQRLSVLGKPYDELSETEEKEADEWILGQFKRKNAKLKKDRPGICVIDRGPMDPIAFTKLGKKKDKAKKLIEVYAPGHTALEVMPGTLLLLTGNTNELAIRLKVSKREGYTADKLERMKKDLIDVYGEDNIREFDTTGLSIEQMVKGISEIIHLDNYKEMDMKERLLSISKGEIFEEDQ